MQTRGSFIQTLPATGAAFVVAGHLTEGGTAVAQEAAPLSGHFHPEGTKVARHNPYEAVPGTPIAE
jgi:hypothetical protein